MTPILFSPEMVRAILDGRKSQTRRILKSLHKSNFDKVEDIYFDGKKWAAKMKGSQIKIHIRCPYSEVGSKLVVRETWQTDAIWDDFKPSDIPENQPILYTADESATGIVPFDWGKVRSPLFMPKWASRIYLEVTDIYCERIQDISESDAISEGIEFIDRENPYTFGYKLYGNHDKVDILGRQAVTGTAIESYETLFRHINGNDEWDGNPFVWVVCFRRIK
jgi:hypothetical protein